MFDVTQQSTLRRLSAVYSGQWQCIICDRDDTRHTQQYRCIHTVFAIPPCAEIHSETRVCLKHLGDWRLNAVRKCTTKSSQNLRRKGHSTHNPLGSITTMCDQSLKHCSRHPGTQPSVGGWWVMSLSQHNSCVLPLEEGDIILCSPSVVTRGIDLML